MRGVSDHSLTVESREQEAIVKGRLAWQVRPAAEHHTQCHLYSQSAHITRMWQNPSSTVYLKKHEYFFCCIVLGCIVLLKMFV